MKINTKRLALYLVGGIGAYWLLSEISRRNILNVTDVLPKNSNKIYFTRLPEAIKKIVIHHSATSTGDPWSFARYHVSKGWAGIGYHFVIAKDGRIWQTNHLQTISTHTQGQNTNAIGICLVGNYEIERPTPSQMNSLMSLLRRLKAQFPNVTIHPHSEFANKPCPGSAVSTLQLSQYL